MYNALQSWSVLGQICHVLYTRRIKKVTTTSNISFRPDHKKRKVSNNQKVDQEVDSGLE